MIIIREQDESNDYKEVMEMEEKNYNYIQEHIENVKKAYNEYFVGKTILISLVSEEELDLAIRSIANEIVDHDKSKFSDEEFYAYRKKYYPTAGESKKLETDEVYADLVEQEYQKAWKHHFTTNDHHPKYWKVINGEFDKSNTPTDMSLGAIIHMICDWQAMSYKFGGTVLEWYNTKADDEKSYMSERTRSITEEIMSFIYK